MKEELGNGRTFYNQAGLTLQSDYGHILVSTLGFWDLMHNEHAEAVTEANQFSAISAMVDTLRMCDGFSLDAADDEDLERLLRKLEEAKENVAEKFERRKKARAEYAEHESRTNQP